MSATYTPADFTLDSNAALYGGSNLRKDAGNYHLLLNWNRPVNDANHIGYWRLDGQLGDDSASNNPFSFQSAANPFHSGIGERGVQVQTTQKVDFGAVLQYERTQAWTVWTVISGIYVVPPVYIPSGTAAGIIFTNSLNNAAHPGYEFWIDGTGVLHVRLIHDIAAPNYIGVYGSTNVCDGAAHVVVATYDGSSTAAGVKIYLDGVLETLHTESDTLSGSIVSAGPWEIGQQDGEDFYLGGGIADFQLSKVVRSASYIAQYAQRNNVPPLDSSHDMYLPFDENTGTSAVDRSANAFTGTLTNAGMWVVNWMADQSVRCTGALSGLTASHLSAYNLSTAFTITGWVDSDVSPGAGALMHHLNDSSPFQGTAFHLGFSNTIQWWDSTAGAFRDSATAIGTGWHPVAVRLSSGTLTIWKDGSIIKTQGTTSAPVAFTAPLLWGLWSTGLAASGITGRLSHATISNTNRSDGYLQTYATRYPASGVANLTGDLGANTLSIPILTAAFTLPSTAVLQYRIGAGSSPSAAATARAAASFATLNATNTLAGVAGRYFDLDVKFFPKTDTLASDSPSLSSVTLGTAAFTGSSLVCSL